MNRSDAFELFKSAARQVWRNADFALEVTQLSSEEPSGGVLASLQYGGKPASIASTLLQRPQRYLLRISSRLLAKHRDDVWKVMVHEAVHLGIAPHNSDFRTMVRRNGGTQSEAALDDPGVKVEKKVGARFKVQRTFDDEKKAEQWAREQMRAEPGSRWRLSFGGL